MDALTHMLADLAFWHWLVLGAILLALESATGSTYLLGPAAAALATGLLVSLFPMGWPFQVVAFSAMTIGVTMAGRHYIRGKWLGRTDAPDLNDRTRDLTGQRAVAATAFENGEGRVKHGDTEWRAESKDAISAGEVVEIIGVEGASLIVRKPKALS
jgi:membrane protein implicated in regulation of membrane protease activity